MFNHMIMEKLQVRARRLLAYEQVKFIVAGGINTLSTLVIYWILLPFTEYRIAFTASYICGIVISYFLNNYFVFNTRPRTTTVLMYPLIYLIQYMAGIAILWLWVDFLNLPANLGALTVALTMMPLAFLLIRFVLRPN